VRLAWTRGDGAQSCLDDQELRRRVQDRLGRNPFAEDAALDIQGTIWRDAAAWRAELRIVSPDGALLGSRKLESTAPDCAPLSDAAVLAVALAIDPDAASRPPPSAAFPAAPATAPAASATEAVTEPPAAKNAPPAPASPAPAPEPAPLSLEMLARGGIATGVLPRVGPLAAVGGSYGLEYIRMTLELSWLPEQATDDGAFAFGLTFGSAGGCYGLPVANSAALRVCAEMQVGALHAVVRNRERFEPLDAGDHLWLAGSAGPTLAWRVAGPLRLEAGVLAVVPIVRKRFAILGAPDAIFESAPVSGIAYLGVGVGIP
jgi:hypothetical protein